MSSKRETLLTTPAYPFVEAAHYLHIPLTTLRAWCLGQRGFRPVIRLDGKRSEGLSFRNMIEAHVLSAIRREHRIPLPKVREALRYVSKRLDMDRPLAQAQFATPAVDLFVEELDRILNVSRGGQVEIAELIRVHLQRVERDASGVPVRLYPFTRKQADKEAIKSRRHGSAYCLRSPGARWHSSADQRSCRSIQSRRHVDRPGQGLWGATGSHRRSDPLEFDRQAA